MAPAKNGTRDMPSLPMPSDLGLDGSDTMGSLQEAAYLAQMQEGDDDGKYDNDGGHHIPSVS